MFVNPSVNANTAGWNSSRADLQLFGKDWNNSLIGVRSGSGGTLVKVRGSEGYLKRVG
jgi:hypothetical protein